MSLPYSDGGKIAAPRRARNQSHVQALDALFGAGPIMDSRTCRHSKARGQDRGLYGTYQKNYQKNSFLGLWLWAVIGPCPSSA